MDPVERITNLATKGRHGIFISYARNDRPWLDRLRIHLKPYERKHTIRVFDDDSLVPGEDWNEKVQLAIDTAKVAILLVTPAFFASEFIANYELPHILRNAAADGMKVLWIPVSHSSYQITPIAQFMSAHDPIHPLEGLSKPMQNQALVKICQLVTEALEAS